ncbi:phosphohexomutase domain-containing protein [Hydrogenovibrio halophilus]|uniref:phosphomannomutase/phosphoglucomutase n=1 Tax=Hydrogenovibrio halophilus TaxID=373391 RepID=UPI00037FFD90|nr:phosphomannomutase/phosphoglucomutase [Hydrogenovibrio halophilus]
MPSIPCFKAYDIRGKVPDQLNTDLAHKIGLAYANHLQPKTVAIGHDIRLESPELAEALTKGLIQGGADVYDLGLCGTEEIYFATFYHGFDGGIMVTASHNPKGYNGMKLVTEGARPISGDTGLKAIAQRIEDQALTPAAKPGQHHALPDKTAYIQHLLGYVTPQTLKRQKIVFNCGNGSAAAMIESLISQLPIDPIYLHCEPDGHFPNGVPNPLLHENRQETAQAVVQHQADFGVAWDGDFDRCFLFDEKGQFIEGYYLVGLIAERLLQDHPGEKILHDPRLTWNTIELVEKAGGLPIESKTGHAFIKERMRKENALYGGEMSSHHYFRDFTYCDSGMIPWLLIMQQLSDTQQPLSRLVAHCQKAYPCSGEINHTVADIPATLAAIQTHFQGQAPSISQIDGLSLDFDSWRLNVRASNTEPLLRINIETRGNADLVQEKLKEVEAIIQQTKRESS